LDIDAIHRHCLGFSHATENVQWGYDLCFKVDGKLFAVAPLEVAPVKLSLKCTPEKFVELCERPGIISAPYMARAQWVALESLSAVPDDELRELLAQSYELVWGKLPQKRREALESVGATKAKQKPARASDKTAKPARRSKKAASGRRR